MHLPAISALLQRYWWEYRQIWRAMLLRDVLDRILFLFAFGFGFGAVMKDMDSGTSYLAFIAAGICCSSPMMTMTMASTFKVFENVNSTKVWQSWLATPLQLKEIMLSELLYANIRSLPSVFILIGLAAILSDMPNPAGIFPLLPFLMLANMAYGAVGLCFTSHITRSLYFSYVNTLWMTPMFLFSGVFFELHKTPEWLQTLAHIYPLAHVIAVVRPVLLGQHIDISTILISTGALLAMFIVAFTYAHNRMKRNLLS